MELLPDIEDVDDQEKVEDKRPPGNKVHRISLIVFFCQFSVVVS